MSPLFTAFAFAGLVSTTTPPHGVTVHLIHRCRPSAKCLPVGTVRRMKDETARIWSSLDVRIGWIDSVEAGGLGANSNHLTVMLEESIEPEPVSPAKRGLVLAAIHQPVVPCGPAVARVWVTQVKRHAALVRVHGVPWTYLPTTLADLLLARALGRALAHEIGHYLLGTTRHSPRGLMRENFAPEELREPISKVRYGLSRRDREALRPCRVARIGPLASAY